MGRFVMANYLLRVDLTRQLEIGNENYTGTSVGKWAAKTDAEWMVGYQMPTQEGEGLPRRDRSIWTLIEAKNHPQYDNEVGLIDNLRETRERRRGHAGQPGGYHGLRGPSRRPPCPTRPQRPQCPPSHRLHAQTL